VNTIYYHQLAMNRNNASNKYYNKGTPNLQDEYEWMMMMMRRHVGEAWEHQT
jgi:hypothetical protein